MANFDDITGWEDELVYYDCLRTSEAYVAMYRNRPKLPLSIIVDLTGLMLRHPQTKALLHDRCVWQDIIEENIARDSFIDEEHPDFDRKPHKSLNKIEQFYRWYSLKKPCPYYLAALSEAEWLAYAIWSGEVSDVLSPEVKNWAERRRYAIVID